jgi:purine-binding chemotaxis protein CheW
MHLLRRSRRDSYVSLGTNDMIERTASSLQPISMAEKQKTSQFVGFYLDGQQYAFRIEQIQEIVILNQVTQTPQVADYVEGVSNLRGTIIPIINLRKLFGLDPKPADGDTRTIVVNVGERTMGCTVDMVSQVVRAAEESIRPAPETVTADGADYVSGFIKLESGLAIILDIEKLLHPEKLGRSHKSEPPEIPSS